MVSSREQHLKAVSVGEERFRDDGDKEGCVVYRGVTEKKRVSGGHLGC